MKQQFPPVCCSSLAVALVKRCSWACQTCSIYWKQIVDHKWPKRASAIKCVHSTHGNTMKVAFFFYKTLPSVNMVAASLTYPAEPSWKRDWERSGPTQHPFSYSFLKNWPASVLYGALCVIFKQHCFIVGLLPGKNWLPDCVAKISESFGWSLQWRPGQPASSLLDDDESLMMKMFIKKMKMIEKVGKTIPLCTFRRNLKY